MLEAGILLFVVAVFVVFPLVRRNREAKLAQRLEETRDPLEASLLEKLPIAWSGRESACHGKETYFVERDQRLPLG